MEQLIEIQISRFKVKLIYIVLHYYFWVGPTNVVAIYYKSCSWLKDTIEIALTNAVVS